MAYDSQKANGQIAAAVIIQAIVYIVVGLRFMTRRKHADGYHVSDWLILLAAFLSTGLAALQIYGSVAGQFGLDETVHESIQSPTTRLSTSVNLRWYLWSLLLIGVIVTGLVKMSVSFFYLQIFSTSRFRRFIVPWIVAMALWTVTFVILLLSLTICGGSGLRAWTMTVSDVNGQKCPSGQSIGYAAVVSGAVTDFLTVIIPLPMVLTLQLPLSRKLAVIGTFALGLMSVGGSVAKAYIYISTSLTKTTNYATMTTELSNWSLVETQVGIIAACLMTLRPLMSDLSKTRVCSRITSSTRNLLAPSRGRPHILGSKTSFARASSEQTLEEPEFYAWQTAITRAERSLESSPVRSGAIDVRREVEVRFERC